MAEAEERAMAAVAGRRTLVVGLGRTGLSVARYLARRGESVAVTDTRTDPPGLAALRRELPEVAAFLGGLAPEAFAHAERVVVSPGVPLDTPEIAAARAAGVPVVGDIELFALAAAAPVVAVTGSNGKSTVASLVAAMAVRAGRETRAGGNLGTPALDLLGEREPDLYVLELSSFQLETVEHLAPVAATVLNVSPDHLDRYPDLERYAQAKGRIYARARVQVVNRDDARARALATGPGRRVGFGLGRAPAEGDWGVVRRGGEAWLARGDEPLMPAAALRLRGAHNVANVLAALALGEAAGLPLEPMLEAARDFPGLPHRMSLVAERGGVAWIDDSKATNVGAAAAAVASLDRPVVLIAGGQGKGQDFAPLARALRGRARAVVLIGEDAPRLEAALAGAVPELRRARTMEEAVRLAGGLARPGDAVLLAPACASFDMFEGFEDRGRAFAEAVRTWAR